MDSDTISGGVQGTSARARFTGFDGAGEALLPSFTAEGIQIADGAAASLIDASLLSVTETAEAIAGLHIAVDRLASASTSNASARDEPGCVVFLLSGVDGPAAAAAVRVAARRLAPTRRVNAIRVGRSAADAARTVAFMLNCRSLTGQLVLLGPPYPASVPAQPDLRPSDAVPRSWPSAGTREVLIRDLVLPCRIGVRRHERDAPQRVRINLVLAVEETPLHDRLEDVVCYDEVVDHIRRLAAGSHINLVETLAERIAEGCFGDRRVGAVRVTVEKLDVYPEATATGVRIVRIRPDSQ